MFAAGVQIFKSTDIRALIYLATTRFLIALHFVNSAQVAASAAQELKQ
jgi:hypothetical protein